MQIFIGYFNFVFSAESVIEVIGIGESFGVVNKKLKANEPGFIEIEVSCFRFCQF